MLINENNLGEKEHCNRRHSFLRICRTKATEVRHELLCIQPLKQRIRTDDLALGI